MRVFSKKSNIFNILSEAISEGIVVVNDKQVIVGTNSSAEQMFSYGKDELLGKSLDTLIPKKFHSGHSGHFNSFLEDKTKRKMGKGGNLYGLCKDRREFPLEVGLNPFEIYGNTYVMALVVDITERKNYTETLERTVADRTELLTEALEKEHELSEIKSRFISMASHEFRTPLTAIVTSVNLIRKYNDLGFFDKQEKHFDRIKSSVHNLTNILNDFLSLEKMESNKVSINSTEVDFLYYIKDVLADVNPWAKENQQVIHEHTGDDKIRIDTQLTRNILLNLLSNALKYSPDQPIVKLMTQNKEGNLLLKVIDTGMGIPEEDQKKMFTRFYRASNVNEISGTGLGLTIVKRYLDKLGGNIDFSSKLGKGTTFNVSIPLA